MIILTDKSLIAQLGEAVVTAAPHFVAQFEEIDGTARASYQVAGALIATPGWSTIVAAPAAGLQRRVSNYTVFNRDTIAHTVEIQVAGGMQIYYGTLAAGASIDLQAAFDALLAQGNHALTAQAGGVPTTPLQWTVSYQAGPTLMGLSGTLSTAALATMFSGLDDGAGRALVDLTIYNPNLVSMGVTVSFVDGSTIYALRNITLKAGETWTLSQQAKTISVPGGGFVPHAGDYTAAMVTNDSSVTGSTVTDALQTLDSALAGKEANGTAAGAVGAHDSSGTAHGSVQAEVAAARAAYASLLAHLSAIETAITGIEQFKGLLDCSGNPNYPVAVAGQNWFVSVSGKIGGASGVYVSAGDMIFCIVSNAGGTQAAVGADFFILQTSLNGVVFGPGTTTNGNLATWNGALGVYLANGPAIVTSIGAPGADTNIPTEAAVRLALAGLVKRVDISQTGITSIAVNTDSYDGIYATCTAAAETLTIAADTGTGQTMMKSLLLQVNCTNAQTLSWTGGAKGFVAGANPLPAVTSGAGKEDYFAFVWSASANAWRYTGSSLGF